MELKRYALVLDLIDDPEVIHAYKKAHRKVWPAVIESIEAAGIINMEIYHTGNRLFMMMEVNASFSFEKKAEMDAKNPKVQENPDTAIGKLFRLKSIRFSHEKRRKRNKIRLPISLY